TTGIRLACRWCVGIDDVGAPAQAGDPVRNRPLALLAVLRRKPLIEVGADPQVLAHLLAQAILIEPEPRERCVQRVRRREADAAAAAAPTRPAPRRQSAICNLQSAIS